jgi:peptidyl-prolyl cis-trans isomerase C
VIRTLIKEPLVQFLLFGGLLFILLGGLQPQANSAGFTLNISASDQQHIIDGWRKQWGRPPSAEEFTSALKAEIRNRILFQEARALNLQLDDLIIQRRMVQKLEYIQEATGMLNEPNEARMIQWFRDNRSAYEIPSTLSFKHVYFSTDTRKNAAQDAQKALVLLRAGAVLPPQAGDPYPNPGSHQAATLDSIAAEFGEAFSAQLEGLQLGQWSGPLRSGLGVHLVKLTGRNAAQVAPLAAIRQQVENDYTYARRQQVMATYYAKVRARYRVNIEALQTLP